MTSLVESARRQPYIRTVTKWLKGSPEGILDNVKGIFQGDKSIRDEPMSELERQVEVRCQWTRLERCGKGNAHRVEMDGTEVTVGLGVGGPNMRVGGTALL
jgi:hypothetical protein